MRAILFFVLKNTYFRRKQRSMKYLIFLLITLFISSCNSKTDTKNASISGEIESLGKDTIFFYGTDQFYPQVDTIPVRRGKFHVSLAIDTLTSGYLYVQSLNKELPIFIDRNEQIHLVSKNPDNLNDLQATGNEYCQDLYQFLASTHSESADSLHAKVKKFIQTHPYSYADLYLIDHYMLQKESPNYEELDSITANLSGLLRDTPYMTRLMEYIKERKSTAVGRIFPFFNLPSTLGKKITRMNTFQGKVLLLHYWASWDSTSRAKNKELREFYQKFKSNKHYAMLGISFDTDTNMWKEAIEADSMEWVQAYFPEGFTKGSEKNYGVESLPCIYLLSQSGQIKLKSNDLAVVSDSLQVMLDKMKRN